MPLVVLAGKEYGSGSSRDWAAKGTQPARRARGDRRVLRAHPPLQPGRHGRAAAAVPRRRDRRVARAHRRGGVLDHRASTAARPRRSRSRPATRSSRRACGSTRRRRSSTTSTAGSCRSCCASCSRRTPVVMPLPDVLAAADGRRPVRATSRRRRRSSATPAAAFAEVERRHASARPSRACAGTGDGPSRRGRRPHRRDRPDRPPHRRRRLPVVHRRRRLGPVDPRRPARRARSRATASSPGVVGKKPIHLLRRRRAQEGPRAQGPAHRHRREGRRRGARRWCASATSR